jgi:hypothetical protein
LAWKAPAHPVIYQQQLSLSEHTTPAAMAQPLDMAKTLVRSVARAFYETPAILIVDALVIHSA